jgi:hypothetical protein
MKSQTAQQPNSQTGRLAMSWIVTPNGLEARWVLDESAHLDGLYQPGPSPRLGQLVLAA